MANLVKVICQVHLRNLSVRCIPAVSLTHYYSTNLKPSSPSSSLAETRRAGEVSTTLKKVKESTKTAVNLSVIIIGVSITGSIFYVVLKELFSSQSPNNIYSAALDECIANDKVKDVLGEPIKGHGEETRRGRHRHVGFQEYFDTDGKKAIKLRFHLKGSRRRATAYVEKKQNDKGKYEYVYLVVVAEGIIPVNITIINNRTEAPLPDINAPLPQLPLLD